ncbi:hypothetical protein AK812_SmicGene1874 [Symbiodinium microadriaticum]|uniref:Uncharacterized protein n=1 Tax=Symbiodinium microadriaticum TaxID=2951 RepID=A0A1Q9F369_SYMMI|nr:hypothetical protein AK812_SmicGene1874 [Symbiodinium microadriaticum]
MTTKKRGQNPGLNPWPRPRRLLPWTLGRLPPDLASAPAPIDEEDNENNRENPQADRAESNRSNEDNAAQAGGTSALPSLKDHLPSSLSDNEPAYKSYHKNVMNRGESPPAGIRMPRVWRCGKHIERPSRRLRCRFVVHAAGEASNNTLPLQYPVLGTLLVVLVERGSAKQPTAAAVTKWQWHGGSSGLPLLALMTDLERPQQVSQFGRERVVGAAMASTRAVIAAGRWQHIAQDMNSSKRGPIRGQTCWRVPTSVVVGYEVLLLRGANAVFGTSAATQIGCTFCL